MATIVLAGLEFQTQAALTRVLDRLEHEVLISRSKLPVTADVVICSGDDDCSFDLVRSIRKTRPALPIVVVTHRPEMGKWLDALDAGAADYFSEPFEEGQVRWVLAAAMDPNSKQQLR